MNMNRPIISVFFLLPPRKPEGLALDRLTLDDPLEVRKVNPGVVVESINKSLHGVKIAAHKDWREHFIAERQRSLSRIAAKRQLLG